MGPTGAGGDPLRPLHVARRSLAEAGRAADRGDHRGSIFDASFEGLDDLPHLRFAPHERGAADLIALAAHGLADDRRAVAPHLELVPTARQLARRRVGEHLTARRRVRQRRRAIDDFARRSRAIDARAPRGDPHRGVRLREAEGEIDRARRFVSQRLAGPQVSDDRVPSELGRVGAARAKVREQPLTGRPLRHLRRQDGRHHSRAAGVPGRR